MSHDPLNPNCPLNMTGWASSMPQICHCNGYGMPSTTPSFGRNPPANPQREEEWKEDIEIGSFRLLHPKHKKRLIPFIEFLLTSARSDERRKVVEDAKEIVFKNSKEAYHSYTSYLSANVDKIIFDLSTLSQEVSKEI